MDRIIVDFMDNQSGFVHLKELIGQFVLLTANIWVLIQSL